MDIASRPILTPPQSTISPAPSATPSEIFSNTTKLVAELSPIAGDVGKGTAARNFGKELFQLLVVAELIPPSEGKFYEGWLVDKTPELHFISTGRLEQRSEGVYVNAFSTSTDYMDHAEVVITEETEADGLDGKPEVHVLEGTFEAE